MIVSALTDIMQSQEQREIPETEQFKQSEAWASWPTEITFTQADQHLWQKIRKSLNVIWFQSHSLTSVAEM